MSLPYPVPRVTPAFAVHAVGSIATVLFGVVGVQAFKISNKFIDGKASVLWAIALTTAVLGNVAILAMHAGRSEKFRVARVVGVGAFLGPLNAGFGMIWVELTTGNLNLTRIFNGFVAAVLFGFPVCAFAGIVFGVLYVAIHRSLASRHRIADSSATVLSRAALWLIGIGIIAFVYGQKIEPRVVPFAAAITLFASGASIVLAIRRGSQRRWLARVRAGEVAGWRIVTEKVPGDLPALWDAPCGAEALAQEADASSPYRTTGYQYFARVPLDT